MNDKRAALISQALKDPAFKAQLLKDPKAVIEKAAGVKLPAGLTVKVVEDTAAVVHLVLPPAASRELTEKELASAAGGAGGGTRYWGSCQNTGDFAEQACTNNG